MTVLLILLLFNYYYYSIHWYYSIDIDDDVSNIEAPFIQSIDNLLLVLFNYCIIIVNYCGSHSVTLLFIVVYWQWWLNDDDIQRNDWPNQWHYYYSSNWHQSIGNQ